MYTIIIFIFCVAILAIMFKRDWKSTDSGDKICLIFAAISMPMLLAFLFFIVYNSYGNVSIEETKKELVYEMPIIPIEENMYLKFYKNKESYTIASFYMLTENGFKLNEINASRLEVIKDDSIKPIVKEYYVYKVTTATNNIWKVLPHKKAGDIIKKDLVKSETVIVIPNSSIIKNDV